MDKGSEIVKEMQDKINKEKTETAPGTAPTSVSTMPEFVIPLALLQTIVQYLQKHPHIEVDAMVQALVRLKQKIK